MRYWTDDETEYLIEMVDAGATSKQCAEALSQRFGRVVTPMSVVGRAHRLGLVWRSQVDKIKQKRNERRKKKPRNDRKQSVRFAVAKAHVNIDDNMIPHQQRKQLQELERCDCRWPVGEPRSSDFFFCGGCALPGLPYCEQHARRAYKVPLQWLTHRS